MSGTSNELERLISRFLDGESDAVERAALNQKLRSDPAARALYEEHAALNREVGQALRQALGRTIDIRGGRSPWQRVGRLVATAVAAGVALAMWWGMPRSDKPADRTSRLAAQSGGWGQTPAGWDEAVWQDEPVFDRPQVQQRATQRNWIVIPSGRPDEYLVIAVDQVRTRSIGVDADY